MNEDPEEFILPNALDIAILSHRDAHFGGQFGLMLEYYLKEGKGVNVDFDLMRIKELALMEQEMGENLAGVLLTGSDAEKVGKAKDMYKKLKNIYDDKSPFAKLPQLIADLILSEEEEPQNEIEAIVQQKGLAVTPLLDIIREEDFYDPLFPGYGLAPALALKCLERIGDKRAIVTLFETIGSGDFFDEDVALKALHAIGEPAKTFLLRVLGGKPINVDNEKAAIALITFKDDPEVSKVCLERLLDPSVQKEIPLSTYLILVCEGLQEKQERATFLSLLEDETFPKVLKQDIKTIAKSWG
jgi:hypothetical protein